MNVAEVVWVLLVLAVPVWVPPICAGVLVL